MSKPFNGAETKSVKTVVPTFKMKKGDHIVTVDNNCAKRWKAKGYKRVHEVEKVVVKQVVEEETNDDIEDAIDISSMDEDALNSLIESEELDLDLEEYEDIEAKRDAVFQAMSGEEDEE